MRVSSAAAILDRVDLSDVTDPASERGELARDDATEETSEAIGDEGP